MKIIMTTLDSIQTGKQIAQRLLEAKCAACVQVLKNTTSLYWWQGKIVSGEECLLLIKTNSEKLAKATEILVQQHPYEVPEVITGDFAILNKSYGDWFEKILD